MNWSQTVPAIVWLAIGLAIAVGAHSLGLGALNNPGPGLFAFIIGVGIAVLSASLIASDFRLPPALLNAATPKHSRAVIAVIAALAFYALALERIGFVVCTVLFLFSLFVVLGRKTWLVALSASVLITAGSYCVFVWALKINLPAGPLGI
jgi:putative tricarboxylic transport membrane protein